MKILYDIVRDPLRWTFVDIWRTLRDYRDSLKPIAFWLALSWTSIWKYFALQHFAMPRSWAIQTCDIGAWATWNVEVICLRLRHCDFLPQDCLTERGYVRLIPTLGTWKTQVLDKPSVDVLFKCMCNSQAISDLLPSAVPRTLQIANGSNQETKEKQMFQCFLAAMCSIEEQMLWQLDVLILFGFERMPILLQMGRSSRLATVRIRSGIWGEWGWNFFWKWCSDMGVIFNHFQFLLQF